MDRILIVDRNEEFRDHINRFLNGLDYSTYLAASCTDATKFLARQPVDVALIDADTPGEDLRKAVCDIKDVDGTIPIIVMHSDAGVAHEMLGDSAKEVFRILQKPFFDAELNFQLKRALESKEGPQDGDSFEDLDEVENKHSEFIGQCPAIRKVFRTLGRVAKTDASVIILGETGTGKELVAWTIHKGSLRAEGPFVKVNCAALPEQLLESELFGYERGAFTGADRTRVGRFEHANGGTIFLDEVADMSLYTQAKLLRVLQHKEFERLGSNTSIKTDVRIISATNKELMKLMHEGAFREDLFYRLNVISIHLPPLRERGGDIGLLLEFFLKRSCAKAHRHIRGFDKEALGILNNYSWPGNIREMENTLERAVIMAEGDTIRAEDLDLIFLEDLEKFGKSPRTDLPSLKHRDYQTARGSSSWDVILPAQGIHLEEAECQLVEQALERCGGSQKKAAALLGVSTRVLNYKVMNMRRDHRL